MLCTSTMQCINVDRLDKSLTGKGRRGGPQSQFKVHKVNPGGIRMFESISNPGNYIRLKDGKIDCGVKTLFLCKKFLHYWRAHDFINGKLKTGRTIKLKMICLYFNAL